MSSYFVPPPIPPPAQTPPFIPLATARAGRLREPGVYEIWLARFLTSEPIDVGLSLDDVAKRLRNHRWDREPQWLVRQTRQPGSTILVRIWRPPWFEQFPALWLRDKERELREGYAAQGYNLCGDIP